MDMNLVILLCLLALVCFIQALKGLSHLTMARCGNAFGMTGMAIAVVTTITLIYKLKAEMFAGTESGTSAGFIPIFAGLAVGGGIGAYVACMVKITKMSELMAAMHSLIGLVAVCIVAATVAKPLVFGITMADDNVLPPGNRVELLIGTFVSAITFSGLVIAFGKLSGKCKFRLFQGAPVQFAGQHMLNLLLAMAMFGFGILFFLSQSWLSFIIMTTIAFVLGVLTIIPIGGVDISVVVSMLNSYSGWAAAGIGLSLNNPILIIASSLAGSSGVILSYITRKAMNRSFFNVTLGGFGSKAPAGAVAGGSGQQRLVKSGSPDNAAFLMGNVEMVIVIPGYGLVAARAQHALRELTEKLSDKGVTVRYAIHPVAGRMPGHMNVPLAEAEVPYDQASEMEDINGEFGQADVVLMLGANDMVNPAAKSDPKLPTVGIPILEAYKAKTIIANRCSMNADYAGLGNELFYMDKTMMVPGDAKKIVEDMVKSVEQSGALAALLAAVNGPSGQVGPACSRRWQTVTQWKRVAPATPTVRCTQPSSDFSRCMQQDSALSVYFHLTLTVMVDDSQSSAESPGFQMDPSRVLLAFNDPEETLAWLRQWHSLRMPSFLPVRATHDDLTFSTERRTIQLDVDRVYRQTHEVNHFLQPPVTVVDYSMPRTSGLEFRAELKDLPCMTILPTGMADENIAVQGFNGGLIDCYIKKDNPATAEWLSAEIEVLQVRYLSNLSSTLRGLLPRHSFSFLSNVAITWLVRELSTRYRFIEYCLYPHPVGVLLFAVDRRATLMAIETNASMLTHPKNAEVYNAPDALLKGLHDKQIIPFFWLGDNMYTSACVEWEQYCLPAEVCQGRELYYYTLFDMPGHLPPAQVYSYTQFLTNHEQDPDTFIGRKSC